MRVEPSGAPRSAREGCAEAARDCRAQLVVEAADVSFDRGGRADDVADATRATGRIVRVVERSG